jgi:hypothetical protein
MITVSDTARAILNHGSFVYHATATSWLGDELLATNIPISGGSEDADRGLNVPKRVVLEVPRRDRGVNWIPNSDTDPLAAAGQVLKLMLGVQTRGADGIEWFQRGEYVILSSEADGDSVRVIAASRLYLVAEAGFVSPFQPSGTIAGTLRALIEPALSADLDAAPADRAVPGTINWDNRITAVNELLDAWPATARENEYGYLEVAEDVVPTVAVRSFTDGTDLGGYATVIEASGKSTREYGFNVVVATGTAADGGEVRGQAEVTSGPWAYGTGPANPLPVPFGYSSPLLTTQAQCTAAAQTVLRRKMREGVLRRYTVRCAPDPTLQDGDCVAITTSELDSLLCTVESLQLPHTPAEMTMTVVSTS